MARLRQVGEHRPGQTVGDANRHRALPGHAIFGFDFYSAVAVRHPMDSPSGPSEHRFTARTWLSLPAHLLAGNPL